MVKENDLEVNRSHLNTTVTRKIAQNIILSRLPHSHHWKPPGSDFVVSSDNLDKVHFSVFIDAEDDNHPIRSVCVIHPPPDNMNIPGSIAVLSTVVEFERNGFGSTALKVALLYMKEHYVHRNVQVLADTFEDFMGDSAVEFWEKWVSNSARGIEWLRKEEMLKVFADAWKQRSMTCWL